MISKLTFENDLDWLKARNKGVGGSDVAIILGESEYTSVNELIARKKQEPEIQEISPIAQMGHIMEPVIFEKYVKKDYPKAISYDKTIMVNPHRPYLLASLDAIEESEGIIIEIKFVSLYGTSKWKSKDGKDWELPKHYWYQVQHYMHVMDLEKAVVYAFMQSEADVIKIEVARDHEFGAALQVEAVDFMEKVKKTEAEEIEPKLPIAQKVSEDVSELWKINKDIKELTSKKKILTTRILEDNPENETFTVGKIIVSARNGANGRILTLK